MQCQRKSIARGIGDGKPSLGSPHSLETLESGPHISQPSLCAQPNLLMNFSAALGDSGSPPEILGQQCLFCCDSWLALCVGGRTSVCGFRQFRAMVLVIEAWKRAKGLQRQDLPKLLSKAFYRAPFFFSRGALQLLLFASTCSTTKRADESGSKKELMLQSSIGGIHSMNHTQVALASLWQKP